GVAPAAVSPVNKLPLKIDDQFQSIELSGKSDHWSQQDDLIIQSSSQSISVYGLDGAKLWSFGIPDELTFSEGLPATSKNTLWATTVDGRVYAMDLRSGALHWYRNGEEKYLRMPLLSGDRLLMFVDMKHNMTWS